MCDVSRKSFIPSRYTLAVRLHMQVVAPLLVLSISSLTAQVDPITDIALSLCPLLTLFLPDPLGTDGHDTNTQETQGVDSITLHRER